MPHSTQELYIECFGSTRHYSKCGGNSAWRLGKMVLMKTKHHHLNLSTEGLNNAMFFNKTFRPNDITKLILKQQHLRVEFRDGEVLQLNKAQSINDQQAIYDKLLESKDSPSQGNHVPLSPRMNTTYTSYKSTTPSPIEYSNKNTRPATYPVFTSVKNAKAPASTSPSPSLDVKKGISKSADVPVLRFYGSSQTKPRSVPFFSSEKYLRKRRLDFSVSPKLKRPCLSDVSYSWYRNRSFESTPPEACLLQGFSNLGNTCYMNAILQSLDGLHCFRRDLFKANSNLAVVSNNSLFMNLVELFAYKRQSDTTEDGKRERLHRVKAAISKNVKRFSGNQQHDAHEFLSQVLDQVKEEVNYWSKETGSHEVDEKGDHCDKIPPIINPTVQTFHFEIIHSITCTECGENLNKKEDFNDLSIDIPIHPSRGDVTLQDALDTFFRHDDIEYSCGKCPSKTSQASHTFSQLPRILVLHVKRYDHVNRKNSLRLIIPTYITLQSHCDAYTQSPKLPSRMTDYSSYKLQLLSHINDHTPEKETSTLPNDQKPCDDEEWRTNTSQRKTYSFKRHGNADRCHAQRQLNQVKDIAENTDKDKEVTEKQAQTPYSDSDMVLPNMTEEEMFELAIKQSLHESDNGTTSIGENIFTHIQNKPNHAAALKASPVNNSNHVGYTLSPKFASFAGSNQVSGNNGALTGGSIEESGISSPRTLSSRDGHGVEEEDDSTVKNVSLSARPDRTNTQSETFNSIKSNDNPILNNQADNEDSLLLNTNSEQEVIDNTDDMSNIPEDNTDPHVSNFPANAVETTDIATEFRGGTVSEEGFTLLDVAEENVNAPFSNAANPDEEPFIHLNHGVQNEHESKDYTAESEKENIAPEHQTVPLPPVIDLVDGDDAFSLDYNQELEDIKRATELSLKEFEERGIEELPPEYQTAVIKRSPSDQKVIDENCLTGQLPHSYALVGVVSHLGQSSSHGHYICDVYDPTHKSWLSYDDTQVTRLKHHQVLSLRQKSGYIFFYQSQKLMDKTDCSLKAS